MFGTDILKNSKAKLLTIAVAAAIGGAAFTTIPAGNQAEALGVSIRIGPNNHGHHGIHHHRVSPSYVYRKLRRHGFYRIHSIRDHGSYYTAYARRHGDYYLVYVSAYNGRIVRVEYA